MGLSLLVQCVFFLSHAAALTNDLTYCRLQNTKVAGLPGGGPEDGRFVTELPHRVLKKSRAIAFTYNEEYHRTTLTGTGIVMGKEDTISWLFPLLRPRS